MTRILNVQPKESDGISEEVKEQMKALFEKGIEIDDDIFTQQRIKKPIKASKSHLYCFYPTTLVTKPLFDTIFEKYKAPMMTYGPYGIAKTSGYILYWYLSSYVNDYLFQA